METSDFPLFPLEPFLETLPEPELDEEPRLLEVTQEEDTDDEEDPNPEKISTLVHSLFASPLKKPKPGSSKENFARRSRGYFAVLPQNFKATIIELLPDCIKEPIESNDSLDAFKFAGIMVKIKNLAILPLLFSPHPKTKTTTIVRRVARTSSSLRFSQFKALQLI